MARIIKIAFLSAALEGYESVNRFEQIFKKWNDTNPSYVFDIDKISDRDIVEGKLEYNDYDLLLFPGIGRGYAHIFDEPFPVPWKENIRKFVADGGGYLGTCGGAIVAGQGFANKPNTFWEFCGDKSALKIANAYVYQDISLPVWGEMAGQSAYLWYGHGIPVELEVNKNHPIFAGYPEETRIVSYIGGPGFVDMKGDVDILMKYKEELSVIAPLHIWKWGPITKTGERALKGEEFKKWLKNRDIEDLFDLKDWDKQDSFIETNIKGKAAGIANKYGEGRVVVFGPHPEWPSWRGGHIEEAEDTPNNRLGELYSWKDGEDVDNDWIILRSAAWIAKIPDDDLPPIPL